MNVRLILEGVIFFTTVATQSGEPQLWLLMLDPGHHTGNHHRARLYVTRGVRDQTSREFDGTDSVGPFFELAGEHLRMTSDEPPPITGTVGTRKPGTRKPCLPADCNHTPTFAEQSNDLLWVNTLSTILSNTPLQPGRTRAEAAEAMKLRDDVLATSYSADDLLLARVVLDAGKLRTYLLWGETDPNNETAALIRTYAFIEPWRQCAPNSDPHSAVTQTIAIEFDTDGTVAFTSRPLGHSGQPGEKRIVLQDDAGELNLTLSSMLHGQPPAPGDFNAYYELLVNPGLFAFLPLPALCTAGDSGGACSPATGTPPRP